MTWPVVALRDVLASPLMNGRSVKDEPGGFPVLRLSALREYRVDLGESKAGAWTRPEAERYLAAQGDFLVARGNGSLKLVGRGALVGALDHEVAFPDTMIRVRPRSDRIDSRFLAYLWNAPQTRDQVERLARTTAGIYKVNQSHLESIELPLPPVEEQRRIVDLLEDHLSRLDAADAYLEASEARLRGLHERLVLDAITGADRDTERFAPTLSNAGTTDGELPSLPREWRWARLGEVADVVGGVTKDAKKQSDPTFVEVPYLRVANVQRGHLRLDQVATIRVDPRKARVLALERGDVLLNEGGDRDKLARGWVWEDQVEDCIHQNHVFRARIHEPRLDPYFLSWTANAIGGSWAERNGKQSVNLASISLRVIRKMPVIIPAPGEAERRVAIVSDQLSLVRRLAEEIDCARKRGAGLRRSLLAAAFSGRLTGDRKVAVD